MQPRSECRQGHITLSALPPVRVLVVVRELHFIIISTIIIIIINSIITIFIIIMIIITPRRLCVIPCIVYNTDECIILMKLLLLI
jgi:hypothetical protein